MPRPNRAKKFSHGRRFDRNDRARYAEEWYPEARHRDRARNKDEWRQRSRSPPFSRAVFREHLSNQRESKWEFDHQNENEHKGNSQDRNSPFFEESTRFKTEMGLDIYQHQSDWIDTLERQRIIEQDYNESIETREFFQSTTLSHQTFPEEHFSRDAADRSPPWRSSTPYSQERDVGENGNLGFSIMAEGALSDMVDRMDTQGRPVTDVCSSMRSSWWPGQQSVQNQVMEMLHACRNEENIPPPSENGVAFMPQFAPFPGDGMAGPNQPMKSPRLAPLCLDTMSEEAEADAAGDILYLLYQVFNEKITQSTMPASTASEPLSEEHASNQKRMGYGPDPPRVEKTPTGSSLGKDAITARDLHKEIQLHLGISFPSVKALCLLLRKYKNLFQVRGSVDDAGWDKDSPQGRDLEEGELPDEDEQSGNSQGEAADDLWLSVIIQAKFDLILCRTHSNKPDTCNPWECQDLHICRHYLLSGKCSFGKFCKFQHNLNSVHNRIALQSHLLHRFPLAKIFELARMVKYRNDSTMPRLCTFYNGDGCKNQQCSYLHVCKRYIQGDCSPVMQCSLSHSLSDLQPKAIFVLFGLDFSESQLDVMELIRKALRRLCMDQKLSFDINRSEKPKSKQTERMSRMPQLKTPRGGGKGDSPVGSKPGPYTWSPKAKKPAASAGQWQWQKQDSAVLDGPWSDIASQTEVEELYQNFLKASRAHINLNGTRVEVDFLAMSASVNGAETRALQRRPAGPHPEPSLPET